VWVQGGFKPNRQVQKPEAGYCIVIRYDEKTTSTISNFMTKVRSVLPPTVEYSEQNLHTTVGTYGKGDIKGFTPDSTTLQRLMESVERGIHNPSRNLRVDFGSWLYNNEAILISGYPNQDLWRLCQNIGNVCQENGVPLEMGRMMHITTARFISRVTAQVFDKFRFLMQSAPAIESATPGAIDLATWCCDGLRIQPSYP